MKLLLLSDVAGTLFGTEDFCVLLYSLIRMQLPKTIVELGSGLGVSAFWMALAAKRNGTGHVWSVDDLSLFDRREELLGITKDTFKEVGLGDLRAETGAEYFQELGALLGLGADVTFVHREIDLGQVGHFDDYPFSGEQIDLLFSDFKHEPRDILDILGEFLPRMSAASSIFIDSASTSWSSYLLLERVVDQLNGGLVAGALQDRCPVDLRTVLRNRRISLIHLTERKVRSQNSAAWLKIEPIDVVPQPRAFMRP